MADDSPQVEAQAREMGWVPQDQFRGDTAKWVDAPTFVKRGEEVMPLLKANNKRLVSELDQLRGQLTETQALVRAGQEAIDALKENQTEFTKAAVQRTKAEIRVALRAARESQDVTAIEELEEQLDDIRDTEREIKSKPPAAAPAPAQPRQDPEFISWQRDNPWFGKQTGEDARRTAYVIAEAQALRSDPENKGLVGRAFYEKAAANVDAILNPRQTNSRVESGTGGGSEGSGKGSPGKKTYRDLPAEAKAVCDRQQAMLVGQGRAFKTAAEWQQNYADQYFAE